MTSQLIPTATHWGNYLVEVNDGRIVAVRPHGDDTDPSPIGQSLLAAMDPTCRIGQPMVRAGYLAKGPDSDTSGRGAEPFVPVPWDKAIGLVAEALLQVKQSRGNEAIYAGSYGWASAGRFHHAQSQLRRFMKQFGGYTYSVNTYSTAAAEVILPHVVGPKDTLFAEASTWDEIARHSDLVVAFGGLPLKNAQVTAGSVGRHTAKAALTACRAAGVDFVNVSPIRDDVAAFLDADQVCPRPNTDTAVMLALARTLVEEGRHDTEFLDRHCTGFARFQAYLMGDDDGEPKDADWAETISGVPAATIRRLARRMADGRTLITVSWSLQRADHGEQPYWMAVTLAAMLGQIGLPGGGFGFGYCAIDGIGARPLPFDWASLEQGENPVETHIPVARIADMLLNPGGSIDYNGQRITYPQIDLVYWAGGNPFHHHQDLNRLLEAWRRPRTIVAHEPFWNAHARHADIVLPATTALERNDFACSRYDTSIAPMHRAVEPFEDARSDYDIFAAMSRRLGFGERFTEGRDEMDWVRHLYEVSQQRAARYGYELPDFDTFWRGGPIHLSAPQGRATMLQRFRDDPDGAPLTTPSGKIEVFSETIEGFGYTDCPGHASWIAPGEWLGAATARSYPLHLISNQPRTRLHSQLDNGAASQDSKIRGREPARLHPDEAARRGIADGDLIRIFNDRGACLAAAVLSEDLSPGIVQIATGAWYGPERSGEPGSLDLRGNPNVLTPDKGASKLSQGPSALSALVEVERYDGPVEEVPAYRPPLA